MPNKVTKRRGRKPGPKPKKDIVLSPVQIQAAVEELQEYTTSVSRSDQLSKAFLEEGLDAKCVALIVKEALDSKLFVFNKSAELKAEVDDWRTKTWAVEFIAKVHGWQFQSQQLKQDVPQTLIQIANDFRGRSNKEIAKELEDMGVDVSNVVNRLPGKKAVGKGKVEKGG
jgi:hypothetical protein